MSSGANDPSLLVQSLYSILKDLSSNEYPTVENPPGLKKRASVALLIRINPAFSHWPSEDLIPNISEHATLEQRLDAFFAQEWVQHGDPEILFIKRASRQGDRWTGHVALPGGRRDPEDTDDKAAAVRETWEEVGIDLSEANALSVGNLPQRVITTNWAKLPLMVLCPFLFLIIRHPSAQSRPQPTEVASTHWVPLRTLLAPSQRTYEYQDVSKRLAKIEVGIKRWIYRVMLGRMMFSAVRLVPSESKYATTSSEFFPLPDASPSTTIPTSLIPSFFSHQHDEVYPGSAPLLLWGLTLGVMADFLYMFPPHTALELWGYPTFTPWDVRFAIWLLSYNFRKRKSAELGLTRVVCDTTTQAHSPVAAGRLVTSDLTASGKEVGMSGLASVSSSHLPTQRHVSLTSGSAVTHLLDGYYDIVRRAIVVTLIGRVGVTALAGYLFLKRFRWARS